MNRDPSPFRTASTASTATSPTPKYANLTASTNLRYSLTRKSIYDRHLNRTKTSELSKSAFAFLFGEMVQYAQKKVYGVQDLEKKLNLHGYAVGQRFLELLLWRDGRTAKRETRILGILQFISHQLYRAIFQKQADTLEKVRENDDEYMISDNDPVVNTYISVPKEMSQLNCGAFIAGIIEAVLDGHCFPAKVTAHTAPNEMWPGRTVFLIKFEPEVLEREALRVGS
ncbi:TRAPP subunit trs31 [Arthrobotrys megalospora]